MSHQMDTLRSKQTPHVAVFTFPFGTHAAPLYTLTRRLAGATSGAVFSFFNSARSNAATLARIPPSASGSLKNLRVYEISDGCPEDFTFSPARPMEEIEFFLQEPRGSFRKGMEEAVRKVGGLMISCVVSDSFLWFAGEMAEEMGVPWIPLWTGGPSSLQAHVYTDVLRRTVGADDQATLFARVKETLDFIPGLSALRVQDLPEGIVAGDLNSVFANLLDQMGKELPRAAAVAMNTFEGLEPEIISDLKTKFKKCLPVGPLNLLDHPGVPSEQDVSSSECLSWLDRQPSSSVTYVSFGSFMSPPASELMELALGLDISGLSFLWSLKEKLRDQLPLGFLDRTRGKGMVVPWAPQLQVLGHAAVGVFVTHCGWNSVTESIVGGVPMICRPLLGDQRLNARTVSHVWEIGVGIEGGVFTANRLVAALNVVLRTEAGKRMRKRASELMELALMAVGPGGSTMKNLDILVELVTGCSPCC